MGRTVKVDLLLEVGKYLRPAKEASKSTKDVADSLDEAARAGDRTASAVDHAGEAMRETARDAARLDREIEQASDSMRQLAREIARTSDAAARADLMAKLAGQRQSLRGLKDVRSLLDVPEPLGEDDGRRSGTKFLSGFRSAVSSGAGQVGEALSEGLSAAPLQVKAAVGGIIVAGAAAASSSVAAMLSGAVLVGLGGGAVAAGVAAAVRDPAVAAAGASLGASLKDELLKAGDSFKEPTLAAFASIRGEIPGIGSALRNALEPAARYIAPLTSGMLGLVKNVIPGLAAGIRAAEPVIAVLANRLPAIGTALSDAIESISRNSGNAAAGFETLLRFVEGTVRVGGAVVAWLTDAYDWVLKIQLAAGQAGERFLGWVPGVGGTLKDFNTATAELIGTTTRAGDAGQDSGQKMASGWLDAARAAGDASRQVETLTETVQRLASINMDAEESNLRLEAAIDRATEAGRKNTDGISIGTEKGRANRQILLDLAQASNTAATNIMSQTGSQELANAAANRGRDAFMAAAVGMGVSKAEAKRLADQLFAIPKNVSTTVTADTGQALAAARGVVARINSMKARISVYAEPSGGFGGGAHTGFGYSTGMRWGGVRVHAAEGVLREAGVYSPMGPARYAFAEPSTGGEAFIPRRGNTARSLAILEQAAGWYGKTLSSPRYMAGSSPGRGGSGPATVTNHFTIQGGEQSPQQIAERVSQILGRQSNLLTRG